MKIFYANLPHGWKGPWRDSSKADIIRGGRELSDYWYKALEPRLENIAKDFDGFYTNPETPFRHYFGWLVHDGRGVASYIASWTRKLRERDTDTSIYPSFLERLYKLFGFICALEVLLALMDKEKDGNL